MGEDRRDARLAALIAAAAVEFNARGIAGASLARIAREVGLTRAALYYYVADRGALALLAYRASAARMAGDLQDAASAPGNGLAKVLAFVGAMLDPERPAWAVLSELDDLPAPGRSEVAAAHDANVESLRRLIRSGVNEGAIRPCDDEVVAQALIGAIVWAPLAQSWIGGDHRVFQEALAASLPDLLADGQAKDPDFAFVSPVPIERFVPPAPRPFDKEALAAAKLEQLLQTASQLFNRRGVDGVSLDDVGAALGATKGAVYHYLSSKTDLVARCYRRAFDLYEAFAAAAEAEAPTPMEASLTGLWLNVQAHAHGLSPLIEMAGAESLPARHRDEIRRRAAAIGARFMSFGELGVAAGQNRRLDYATLSQIGAGVFQWMPKWLDPADPRAGSAVADEIVALFIKGLRAR